MKTMQTSFKLLMPFVLLLWSCQADAQKPNLRNASPEKIAEFQTQKQSKALNLDKQKTESLESINLKYTEKIAKLREEGELRENREALKQLNLAQNKEVKALLTPDEFKAYKALKQKQFQRIRENNRQFREKIQNKRNAQVKRLQLNDKQLEQMKEIRKKYAAQRRQILAERSKETRQQLKENVESQNKEVQAILSDEQYQEYLKIMAENREQMRKKRSNFKPQD